jgi:hypothetical protein
MPCAKSKFERERRKGSSPAPVLRLNATYIVLEERGHQDETNHIKEVHC